MTDEQSDARTAAVRNVNSNLILPPFYAVWWLIGDFLNPCVACTSDFYVTEIVRRPHKSVVRWIKNPHEGQHTCTCIYMYFYMYMYAGLAWIVGFGLGWLTYTALHTNMSSNTSTGTDSHHSVYIVSYWLSWVANYRTLAHMYCVSWYFRNATFDRANWLTHHRSFAVWMCDMFDESCCQYELRFDIKTRYDHGFRKVGICIRSRQGLGVCICWWLTEVAGAVGSSFLISKSTCREHCLARRFSSICIKCIVHGSLHSDLGRWKTLANVTASRSFPQSFAVNRNADKYQSLQRTNQKEREWPFA